jgi:hypothetical protein
MKIKHQMLLSKWILRKLMNMWKKMKARLAFLFYVFVAFLLPLLINGCLSLKNKEIHYLISLMNTEIDLSCLVACSTCII